MPLNLGGILGTIGKTVLGGAAGFLTGGPAGAVIGGIGASGLLGGGGSRQRGTPGQTIGYPGIGGGQFGGAAPGPFVDFGGAGGMFGGAGAGVSYGPPMLPAPPAQGTGGKYPMTVGGCAPGQLIMPLQMTTRAARIPGYVTVTMPASCGPQVAGQKFHVEKNYARKMGWYTPPRKPLLTASDGRILQKADRLEKKLVRLTRKYTDNSVVSPSARIRQNYRLSKKK